METKEETQSFDLLQPELLAQDELVSLIKQVETHI